jgi:hypothetical protein
MAAELSSEVLARSLSHTLEEAAFVFAEVTDSPPALEPEDLIEARLTYYGPHEGELVLASTVSFAATLAANLLGEDEGGADVVGDDQDAIGELLNMIAGGLVVALFDDAPCRLGLPRVHRVTPDEYGRNLAKADAVATLVEEEGRRIDLWASVRR